jgi:hypothetical protein
MRTPFVILLVSTLFTAMAAAETPTRQKPGRHTRPDKLLPVKGAGAANSCAAFGAGFMKVEGTDTCVKVGGAVSIGVGGSVGSR